MIPTLALIIFLACLVEATEGVTIVLAAGFAHSWRSAFTGTAAALATLVLIVVLLRPLLAIIPLQPLKAVMGAVMLYYGVTWLRKAILRATHRKPLHDEIEIYRTTLAQTEKSGFALAFSGVITEGIEIIVLVVALGTASFVTAVSAALAAVVVAAALALVIRAPLSRVPENTMKLGVGVMLSGVGLFWLGEALRISWPGADAALFGLYGIIAVLAWGTIRCLNAMTTGENGWTQKCLQTLTAPSRFLPEPGTNSGSGTIQKSTNAASNENNGSCNNPSTVQIGS